MKKIEILGGFIEKRAIPILIIVMLISIFFISLMPNLSFNTNIRGFLPDNEMSKANTRVMDYFGEAPTIHFILVEAVNRDEDVLTPHSLSEQYSVIEKIKELEGVEETLSIADVVNILYQYNMDITGKGNLTVDESRSIGDEDVDYDEVRTKLELIFDLLNGKYEGLLDVMADEFPMFSNTSIDNVKLLINLLFSEDFELDDPHAAATIIVINLDGSMENEDLKELVREIHGITEKTEEGLVDIGMALMAGSESAALVEPCEGSLDDLPEDTQSTSMWGSPLRNPGLDATRAKLPSMGLGVVSTIS